MVQTHHTQLPLDHVLSFPPKHNNWPILAVQCPMTVFGNVQWGSACTARDCWNVLSPKILQIAPLPSAQKSSCQQSPHYKTESKFPSSSQTQGTSMKPMHDSCWNMQEHEKGLLYSSSTHQFAKAQQKHLLRNWHAIADSGMHPTTSPQSGNMQHHIGTHL